MKYNSVSIKNTMKCLKAPILHEFVGNEKDFEGHLLLHIDLICEALGIPEPENVLRQQQICVDGFICRPDIIICHKDQTLTVIEVKKASTKFPSLGAANQMGAVGQLLLYQNVLEAMVGSRPRLVLADNKIYFRTYCAFLGNSIPITLLEFQKDCIFIPYRGW